MYEIPRRSYGSAPATRVSSPENVRKFRCAAELQRHLAEIQRKTLVADYAPVAVAEPPACERGTLITPQCLLFVTTTLLLFLSMAIMMIVVILHFATGGKLFANKSARRNSTASQEVPPYNFIHSGGHVKAR